MACLAQNPDKKWSADSLAERTKVPRRYLHKVLQDLVQAELAQSRSGPGGGYSLAMPADGVTILDVVNAVAPVERIRHCPLGLPSHTSLCPLHKELDRAYEATEAAFKRVTLGNYFGLQPTSFPYAINPARNSNPLKGMLFLDNIRSIIRSKIMLNPKLFY